MARKYKWRVGEAPTGQWRSFIHRPWPYALYSDGKPAASIYCYNSYTPQVAKEGSHQLLELRVADHSVTPWKWHRATVRFATLDAAKRAFDRIITKHPEMMPKDL